MQQQQPQSLQKLDYDRLDRAIGAAPVVLVRFPRRTDIYQYMAHKMHALRFHNKHLGIEYEALTVSMTNEFKANNPLLFMNQNNATTAEKVLFVAEPLYFHPVAFAQIVNYPYKHIYLFTMTQPDVTYVIMRALVTMHVHVVDAPLAGVIPRFLI